MCSAAARDGFPSQSAETIRRLIADHGDLLRGEAFGAKWREGLRVRRTGEILRCNRDLENAGEFTYEWPSTSRSQRRVRCSRLRRSQASETMEASSIWQGAAGSNASSSAGFSLRHPQLACGRCQRRMRAACALGVETLRTAPDLSECLLHDVLGCLLVFEKATEKSTHPRRIFSIPGIEYLGVAVGDLLPEFPIIEQLASPPCTSGVRRKRFDGNRKFR